MNSSSDDSSMRARFEAARQDTGAYGKKPLSDDIANRINQQTQENLKHRYEEKVRVAEEETARVRMQRVAEAAEAAELFNLLLSKVDLLAKFITQHHEHELPEEILELIAKRQESRIESNLIWGGVDLADTDAKVTLLPLANVAGGSIQGHKLTGIAPPAPTSDGQVLRYQGGTVTWSDPNLETPKSLVAIREQVRPLVAKSKE